MRSSATTASSASRIARRVLPTARTARPPTTMPPSCSARAAASGCNSTTGRPRNACRTSASAHAVVIYGSTRVAPAVANARLNEAHRLLAARPHDAVSRRGGEPARRAQRVTASRASSGASSATPTGAHHAARLAVVTGGGPGIMEPPIVAHTRAARRASASTSSCRANRRRIRTSRPVSASGFTISRSASCTCSNARRRRYSSPAATARSTSCSKS